MPPSTWNPPSGPGARRAVDEALAAARERDRQLRAEIVRMASDRVVAADELETARAEAADARTLAARALTRSDESAKAGQRAEAATLTDAARVFAMRWRDARARAADAEARVAAADEGRRRAEAGLAANAGALDKAAAAHLASATGRRAAKMQAEVDATVSEISTPAAELVAQAEVDARAERDRIREEGPAAVEPVGTEDLEDALDLESVDPLLDELRAELGLGDDPAAPAGEPSPSGKAGKAGKPAEAGIRG